MCEAGLHISLGIGLRLYNLLLHDYQQLDLQLALLSEEQGHETSSEAIQLLQEVQRLEKQLEDEHDTIEQHQIVYDYMLTAGDVDISETEEAAQLQQLADFIHKLQKDATDKVLSTSTLYYKEDRLYFFVCFSISFSGQSSNATTLSSSMFCSINRQGSYNTTWKSWSRR